jgi:cytochrome c-type biogenesis protein CcmE
MTPRCKRAITIACGLATVACAAALVLAALRENVVFFFTPTQVAANEAPRGRAFRVGGLVERNSVERQPDGITVHFIVTDTTTRIPVIYTGVLPDLFRDGKGVVTQGRMGPDGIFHASQVLAKHDENYMPPEAAHAITKARSADSHALPFTASQTTP